jgi:cytidine deaminase
MSLAVSPEFLLQEARGACDRAYAPYSERVVGAALLVSGGDVISAANMENAVLPLSICAEQAAVAVALSRGHRGLLAIAVVDKRGNGGVLCGACRQILYELGGPEVVVIIERSAGQEMQFTTIGELLPQANGIAGTQ